MRLQSRPAEKLRVERNHLWTGCTISLNVGDDYDGETQPFAVANVCSRNWLRAMFPDALSDWHWESRTVGDILVPDNAFAKITKLDEAAVPRTILPVDLWRLIDNPKAAERGWSIQMAKDAIMKAAPGDFRLKRWIELGGLSGRDSVR